MINDPNILKEIEEISPMLARLHGTNVFKVPDGYFTELSERILDVVTFSNIGSLSRDKIQDVPVGYFETLSSSIMQRIKAETVEDENELGSYPALEALGRHNVFEVPEGYFDNLSVNIIGTIKRESPAKVIPIFARKVWRYAAAAVIAFGLFTTSYFVFIRPNQGKNGFAAINKNTVSDPAALKYNTSKAFNEGIASLSDDEIVGYLENHGNILDNDLLMKNIDTDELPDVTDYLISDEALTNYLDKINSQETQKQ